MTKSMNFFFVILSLCALNQMINGEILKCEFIDAYNLQYTCEVTLLLNINNNMTINGYSGVHHQNKSDTDVEAIRIRDTNTKYIPKNLGLLFNLSALFMYRLQLVEIKSQDFSGMKELERLILGENKLKYVPVDAFSTLSKLKEITLDRNQIKELPNGVFSNNLELERIILEYNKIKFLGSNLFDGLTKLKYVTLGDNICIHEGYYSSTTIIQLKNDIKIKCKNPYEVKMALTTNPIELFLFNGQITRVTNELLTEFIAETEEQQEKLIALLTEATQGDDYY